MAVRYKKLWHILVYRNMKKKDLKKAVGITHYQMYKLANDKDITTDVVEDICMALGVKSYDIMEFIPNDEQVRFMKPILLDIQNNCYNQK